jgi:hypothetical protein
VATDRVEGLADFSDGQGLKAFTVLSPAGGNTSIPVQALGSFIIGDVPDL